MTDLRPAWADVVLMCDDVVTSIEVAESGAPLVDTAGVVAFTGEGAAARRAIATGHTPTGATHAVLGPVSPSGTGFGSAPAGYV